MNYKANCHEELKQLSKDNPDYTFGDILFSVLKSVAPGKGSSMTFLREITDEEYFTLIEKTREKEKED
jgi:hypothetical protein